MASIPDMLGTKAVACSGVHRLVDQETRVTGGDVFVGSRYVGARGSVDPATLIVLLL